VGTQKNDRLTYKNDRLAFGYEDSYGHTHAHPVAAGAFHASGLSPAQKLRYCLLQMLLNSNK